MSPIYPTSGCESSGRFPAAFSGSIPPAQPSKTISAAKHPRATSRRSASSSHPSNLAPSTRSPPSGRLDLFLDTHLYNGAATASLALQAGLPVLTCPGNTFASRVGVSLLNSVGLPELIASDVAHYERLAIHLGTHTNELRSLREKLITHRTTAPLFDTRRFVGNLERAYQNMWDIYAAGRSPEPITVREP